MRVGALRSYSGALPEQWSGYPVNRRRQALNRLAFPV